jgi:tetratricopeptide (TPR) repeat protein
MGETVERPARSSVLLLVLLLSLTSLTATAARPLLVEEGQPRAEIVIAERPTRSVRLAAHELQLGLQKISGARLPIVNEPSAGVVQVFVGQSRFTERLGLSTEELEHGAYRMVSGDGWLALIGQDVDFEPVEPWAKNADDVLSGRLDERWRELTGAPWGAPHSRLHKNRLKLAGPIGVPDAKLAAGADPLEVWSFDERGTFNAVCGFLRSLGMRWYMPGELGEVVPTLATIPLSRLDVTERPDMAVRRFNFRFRISGPETAMWAMRLGLRDPFGVQVAHGLSTMTRHPEAFKKHPDWYALYGGRRDNEPGKAHNQLCLSNEGLFRETVRQVRAQLDRYPLETVSVMPPDGFNHICQCALCAGKAHDEMAPRGNLSDYVWGFVNRVARDVRKTHPDRRVLNCAYGRYTLPPQHIRKLEPNVSLCIVGGRKPFTSDDAQREYRALREAWAAKTDNPILYFENYPFTDGGFYLPAFAPHRIAATINATKGRSMGEDIWISAGRDFAVDDIGFNHFIVYFTARMYWGGPSADVDALFREYCRLFYGPAEAEIRAFFEFCEANWPAMERELGVVDEAFALFERAKAKAEPSSAYARRLGLIDAYLAGLRNKARLLGQKRGPVPKVRLVGRSKGTIRVDGLLDEKAWTQAPTASQGSLRELQTGRPPTFGTSFKIAWDHTSLYVAVRADERPGEPPVNTASHDDDERIWEGDAVELLLETDSHAYYHLVVSPSGALLDSDESIPRDRARAWASQAEVATRVSDDHWIVEMRIPVTDDDNDPLHQVIGHRPTRSLPWHINVGRRRVRTDGTEVSAFSPTGSDRVGVPIKFGHLYAGRAFKFDVDETQTDYLTARASATKLVRQRKLDEALAAFATLAASGVTDVQRTDALEQATAVARTLGDVGRARALAELIPVAAVKKTVLMLILLDERRPAEVVSTYGAEALDSWPFWARGAGYRARGRAYALTGDGQRAERDLLAALSFTGDPDERRRVWVQVAENREHQLHDDESALDAYQSALEGRKKLSRGEALNVVVSSARVLTRLKRYDDAVAVVQGAEPEKQKGRWRSALMLELGDAHRGAGRRAKALAAYQSVVDDRSAHRGQREAAEEQLRALNDRPTKGDESAKKKGTKKKGPR